MTDSNPELRGSADFVQSLARGLAVIRTFDGEHPSLTLAEVARRAGIPAAAARRFIRTLHTLGYIRQSDRHFSLTPKVLELGYSYLSALSLPELMQPHLEELSQQTGESVSGAVLFGPDIVYVARVPTRRIMTVGITIGTRFPAFATSMGRVLLSGLDEAELEQNLARMSPQAFTQKTVTDPVKLRSELTEIRARGWALVDGELEPGLRSVATAIRNRDGVVVAAINISGSATQRSLKETKEQHLPLLLSAAGDIEAELRLQ